MPPASPTEEQPEKPAVPRERRFKLSRACDRCRRRRIKCDEGHPCQSCLNANSPCTFEEPGKRSHPHKSKRATTLEDRMHHLESLIQAIPFNLLPALGFQTAASQADSMIPLQPSYPLGVPPPSLSLFPLMNPSTHFPTTSNPIASPTPLHNSSNFDHSNDAPGEQTRSSPPSYLYVDDEGYTRWQGESSGLPFLDLLVQRQVPSGVSDSESSASPELGGPTQRPDNFCTANWFPDRQPRRVHVNPETLWKLITSAITPELMDNLVQCFLSTSHYLMPFLHVPTFLSDYGNPQKWGEPGFASFIVSICCLSSRHTDDPRVRADPTDGFSAGTQWFSLFDKLRTLPNADRPTLYTIQSVFIAAVYAIGLGKLSRGFALLSEAITLSIDAGLHRSAEAYDCFNPIEDEIRKRTFWCVYLWDKQAGAAFGRPAMIRLRDCDVPECAAVDDEYITLESSGPQPLNVECRMRAFVETVRLFVVLESVVDVPLHTYSKTSPSFLQRASSLCNPRFQKKPLQDEETLLDDLVQSLPPYWAHTPETLSSDNVIRVTQCERLFCAGIFVRMLIHRHRFSNLVSERTTPEREGEQTDSERDAMMACHSCAVQIVHTHMQVATKGLMTYFGVHVIHQLTQAGRTLIAVLLNCKTSDLKPLVPPSLEALRSCVGLLRKFSGRYVCGLRSGDLIEEFCRLTRIPLDTPLQPESSRSRPPWIRPVRKKTPSKARSAASTDSAHGSPEGVSIDSAVAAPSNGTMPSLFHPISPSDTLGSFSPPQPAPPTVRKPRSRTLDSKPLSLHTKATHGSRVYSSGHTEMDLDLEMDMDDLIRRVSLPSPQEKNMGLSGLRDPDPLPNVPLGLSSSAFMSVLQDGNFDMNALFHDQNLDSDGIPFPPPLGDALHNASVSPALLHARAHGEFA